MLELFWTFFRIGAFTFGGGYAMLPVIQRELVEKKGWSTESEILDCYAIGQCTPGVIAVNTATFIGFKLRGMWGGIVATGAVILPSLLIIMVIAACLGTFAQEPVVQHALAGIRVAVAALVLHTVIKLLRNNIRGTFGVCIFAAALLVSILFDVSPVFITLGAIVIGILAAMVTPKKVTHDGEEGKR